MIKSVVDVNVPNWGHWNADAVVAAVVIMAAVVTARVTARIGMVVMPPPPQPA